MKDYSENALVEQTANGIFAELGYAVVSGGQETFGVGGTLGREHKGEVVLGARLAAALARLNPKAPEEALRTAAEELARDRSARSLAAAGRELWGLLRDGVKVTLPGQRGDERVVSVRVIDWDAPERNEFLYVAQLQVAGEFGQRRPDGVGFVNGLPLLLAEYKATGVPLRQAYDGNIRDYRDSIPQLFPWLGLIVVSNGLRGRAGSATAAWEHYAEWKKVAREDEPPDSGLATLLRATCAPARLLDLVENFTLFTDINGPAARLLARNHQYLGVNSAFAALRDSSANRGRLGVFWHTQGSGKSYSMLFFAQKALRKLPGNWTFLVVTDRDELDEQIYGTFAAASAVTEREPDVHAASGEHLHQLLRENHRVLFTLIQKFNVPAGQRHPLLSERDDIIVIADEAHRSQYDTFALNMRLALPNAAFIGFTGTPLLAGEEKTREVFGDYVSIYNFRASVEDGATVPLYYENRIPELQIVSETFNEDMQRVIDEAGLDESGEERLEREFRREYLLITRDERLETIAADIVAHYTGRLAATEPGSPPGKAMVVSIDKATAVRMHDKVRAHWQRRLDELRARVPGATPEERETLTRLLTLMETTDMAVVVSPSQHEAVAFRDKGLDILPHRQRMQREDLAKKFKDADDPFRLVFVCAMWMTGFDVRPLATIYLDKPLRNHTLMQAIARANRVFPGKHSGLIVDYIGVFRDLQRALALYGAESGGGVRPGDSPVQGKDALIADLRAALEATLAFCHGLGVDLPGIVAASGVERLRLLAGGADAVLTSDHTRRAFFGHAARARTLYQAVLPDVAAAEFSPLAAAIDALAGAVRADLQPPDISGALRGINDLLDASIGAEPYVIREHAEKFGSGPLDLSRVDFDKLRRTFASGRRNAAAAGLRAAIEGRLRQMVEQNRTRMDYLEQFQRLIDAYNAGSLNTQLYFEELLRFTERLEAEEQRHIAEQLSEEELTIFDLLTRPDPGLSAREAEQVRKVARDLLATLKREKLVLDWRKKQQSRSAVLVAIREVLDAGLPPLYTTEEYDRRCAVIYEHVFDAYTGAGQSVYTAA